MAKLSQGAVVFEISETHGNVAGAWLNGVRVVEECGDLYLLNDGGPTTDEGSDEVTDCRMLDNRISLHCQNTAMNVSLRKDYALEGNRLRKKVTVVRHPEEGFLHLRSSVCLNRDFRADSYYYTPTNNWHHDTKRDPVGLMRASQLKCPYRFVTGFDNRMVTAFSLSKGVGLGHYRNSVNGVFSPYMTQTTDIITQASEDNLRYTEQGWDFDVLIAGPNDDEPLSSEVHFLLYEGDYYDFIREYKRGPDFREAHEFQAPEWTKDIKLVAFTIPNRPELEAEAEYFGELAEAVGEGYVAPMISFWSYSGDYETAGTFPIEAGPPGNPRFNSANWDLKTVDISAEWLREVVATMQKNEKVKAGLYVQGMLIEELSKAYRSHPEWVIETRDGGKMFSGMRDHADGALDHFDPSDQGLVSHLLSRFEDLMKYYEASWLHFDGGVVSDMPNYLTGRAVLPNHCVRFHEESRMRIKEAGDDKALMMNAASHPHGEMCYQETSFTFDTPISDDLQMDGRRVTWRSVTDIMLFTKMMQAGGKTVVPLYWGPGKCEKVYVPLLLAFGFTPEMRKWMDLEWVKKRRKLLQAAYLLRDSEFIFSSKATEPLWWKDGSEVETFALRLGANRIIPVFNHARDNADVMLKVDAKLCEIDDSLPAFAWVFKPFGKKSCEPLGWFSVSDGKLSIPLKVDAGYHNAQMVVLSSVPLFVHSVDKEIQPLFLAGRRGVDVSWAVVGPGRIQIGLRCDKEETGIILPEGVTPAEEGKLERVGIGGCEFLRMLLPRGSHHFELDYHDEK